MHGVGLLRGGLAQKASDTISFDIPANRIPPALGFPPVLPPAPPGLPILTTGALLAHYFEDLLSGGLLMSPNDSVRITFSPTNSPAIVHAQLFDGSLNPLAVLGQDFFNALPNTIVYFRIYRTSIFHFRLSWAIWVFVRIPKWLIVTIMTLAFFSSVTAVVFEGWKLSNEFWLILASATNNGVASAKVLTIYVMSLCGALQLMGWTSLASIVLRVFVTIFIYLKIEQYWVRLIAYSGLALMAVSEFLEFFEV